MKILLISPASGKWRQIGKGGIFNGRYFRFSMLSLLTVAALSPKDADVKIVDEQLEDIPQNEDFDIVGITVMTATAPRAYGISRHFRERGIPVVLGGFHPSLNTNEALSNADAIVVGPAFGAWQKLLEDLKKGHLEKIYYGDIKGQIPAGLPRHLIETKGYVTVNAAYATMGCANKCRFCSISRFYGAGHYKRNLDNVIKEVASFEERFFIFVDDNLTQDRDFAAELLRRLKPLKKKWITQASVDLADNDEMLRLLRDAGCIGLFIGLESFNEKALYGQEKTVNVPQRYQSAIKKFHSFGIFVESGVIFGFDNDDISVFGTTLRMLEKIGIDAIQVSILTPLPGTNLYEDYRDRIIDTNWQHYDYRHVVFEPRQLSPEHLQAGTDWVIRKFYSPLRILRRLFRWLFVPQGMKNLIYPLGLNIAYFGRVWRFSICGYNPELKRDWMPRDREVFGKNAALFEKVGFVAKA